MYFVMIMWNITSLWSFVAPRRPFKISKVWKKRDIKTLATGRVFGGHFNTRDRSVWEFKLFLFHGIEMKLMHKITAILCVFGSWTIINPFITKYSKNQYFWNTFNTVSEIPHPYYGLWNIKAGIVILSFNNELALLVHWWQQQAAVAQAHYRATNARLIHRLQALCTAHQSYSAFRGRTVVALIWRLI